MLQITHRRGLVVHEAFFFWGRFFNFLIINTRVCATPSYTFAQRFTPCHLDYLGQGNIRHNLPINPCAVFWNVGAWLSVTLRQLFALSFFCAGSARELSSVALSFLCDGVARRHKRRHKRHLLSVPNVAIGPAKNIAALFREKLALVIQNQTPAIVLGLNFSLPFFHIFFICQTFFLFFKHC